MARLKINEKEYEGKCSFKFDRLADKKYGAKDKDGNDAGGFMTLYMSLLQYSNNHLVAFWDCALENLGKDKPSIDAIEKAIEDRIDEDGDTAVMFQEAFKAVDESGFFKLQAKNFWKNLETMKESGKTVEEKAENLKMYNLMKNAYDELKA